MRFVQKVVRTEQKRSEPGKIDHHTGDAQSDESKVAKELEADDRCGRSALLEQEAGETKNGYCLKRQRRQISIGEQGQAVQPQHTGSHGRREKKGARSAR